ncbi:MAG: FadR family transcriptional regulator [Oscillospiraceae bacterium]|nr:FadR family transcriptional regulator [Oscillospiraceae bacterium]
MSEKNSNGNTTGKRAAEEIYEVLRQRILSGELTPGDRLPSERALMVELQRSRPTIREALRRLEQGGYITTAQGTSGAVVCQPSIQAAEEPLQDMIRLGGVTVAEVSEYRQNNDSIIAAWAAKRARAEDVSALEDCIAQQEQALEDFVRFVELDVRFHSALAHASGNQVAVIVTEVLAGVEREILLKKLQSLASTERENMCRVILKQHLEILEAIRRGDSRSARAAMSAHTRSAGRDLRM